MKPSGYTLENESLAQSLWAQNADDLKRLLALIPEIQLKATRKGEIINEIVGFLMGSGLAKILSRLDSLELSALGEAAHEYDGLFDPEAFMAKYGKLPVFDTQGRHQYDQRPAALRLFIHQQPHGFEQIPKDLRAKLQSMVPRPPETNICTLDTLSDPSTSEVENPQGNPKQGRLKSPMVQRQTESAAMQDLRTVLRLCDQEKLQVSEATQFPSAASMKLLSGLLRDGDFFDPDTSGQDKRESVGPIKALAWPLLIQAAGLARGKGGRLLLTKSGRDSLEAPPANVLKDIWNAWISKGIIDEFNRIDAVKGQKGKGQKSFTPPSDRRMAVSNALSKCPAGKWVKTEEFSRFMLAAGYRFEVTKDPWPLYLCDPQYGSLGYADCHGWNILQERYLLCLLFEYAAPLGLIDIAYENPSGARNDFGGLWGTDDLTFLSRYDGLRYIRVTRMGAYLLGQSETYEAQLENQTVSITVLSRGKIQINQGELSPDQILLLEGFAERVSPQLWSLSESRALQSIEKGVRISDLRAFLKANDPQPLPETVESFLLSAEQRGTACICKGVRLLVECRSPEIAEIIARDDRAGAICQRTGDRGLVFPKEKEKSFREAINALGFGMPRS